MQTQDNLTATMQHYGTLSVAQRELFLSVISATPILETQKKRKKAQNILPFEFSEDSFYSSLVGNHDARAIKLQEKHKNGLQSIKTP